MKIKLLVIFAAFCISLAPKANALGLFYQNTTFPLMVTDMKVDALENLKVSEGSISSNGFIEVGNASIRLVAGYNNITQIHHVDVRVVRVLFWKKTTVIVYGL